MLPLDLVRIRSYRGELRPNYVNPADRSQLALAGELIDLYRKHEGQAIADLKEALQPFLSDTARALQVRALAKLIQDRCSVGMDCALEPKEVRRRLFEAAAPHHPVAQESQATRETRGTILSQVAEELESSPEEVENAMYADLPEAQRLLKLDLPTPDWLLRRYNVALAQVVLTRANGMVVEIEGNSPARFRQLFRYVKFYRLMHRIEKMKEGGYRIHLDGPLSLFKQGNKYGMRLAEFLPALLLCQDWRLKADVLWGSRREPRTFTLSPEQELKSHYPDKGVYEIREAQWLRERFPSIKTEWKLKGARALIPLGDEGVLVPDFKLQHPDGRVAFLEIVGFWRRDYLERRIDLYSRRGPGNLILAVAKQLQGSLEGLEAFAGEVYLFREVLVPRDLLAIAERKAKAPRRAPRAKP